MKNQIIQACVEAFEKKGFSETSIQEIVDRLGVTKGTFYYYFASKEQVLMTIHRRYIDELLIQQKELVRRADVSYTEKLYGLIRVLISNITPLGNSARVFHREYRHLNETHMKEVREKRNQVRLIVEEVIRDGIKAKEFRQDLKADIVTLGILGICNWSYQWFQSDGMFTDLEVADIFIDMISRGIEYS
ncbi:TetR/AcrR family transcriptional regulator [Salinibacillus aidingensis]|uniref:TetR/AcrR family transcriptional regulator n=1 Tax=Salinibacillus aidingensis TaxID=237684 RepID=A0ABN1B4F1_9BACI